ncbi:MAG: hypothetical protein QNJ19_12345 [Woeseiaceae bacterium]|nr:hypothetical protein [Woeseiaceae bacterium]
MRRTIRSILDAATFFGLPREQRQIVFYSEGTSYWAHLEKLLGAVLESGTVNVCYISSQHDDPGLQLRHDRLRTFQTDTGWVRNWLFENMQCDVMVMTMPDLDQFQVKRSRHQVHYVYVQHSLVSLHMAYRDHAFDGFDTLFCAGPHHIKEARALEALDKLPPKNLVEHGYERLDRILDGEEVTAAKDKNQPIHVLLAPSWGPQGVIEIAGKQLAGILLDRGFGVTVRPHPQTSRLSGDRVDAICSAYGSHPLFALDTDVAGETSLRQADLMISDWSGAALDFAFGLEKPVLFIDGPRKVNNPRYEEIDIEPFEVFVRDQVGKLLPRDELERAPDAIEALVREHSGSHIADVRDASVFNVGSSASAGAKALAQLLSN